MNIPTRHKACGIAGAFLIALALLFAAYSNTFTSPVALDDYHAIVENPVLRDASVSATDFAAIFHGKFGRTRLIPMVTFKWDLLFGEGQLTYLHATSLAIHILCFFMVFFLVFQIGQVAGRGLQTRELLPSPWALGVWVGAAWALNPVQANTVTYLVQRMASLLTLFYVFSVAAYICGRSHHRRSGRLNAKAAVAYVFCFLGVAASALCKENWAMLPLMLLLTEAWFFQQDVLSRIARCFFRHYLLLPAALAVACLVIIQSLPDVLGGYGVRHFTLGERLMTEARVVVWYLSLFFYPSPHRLSLEHDIDVSTSILQPVTTLPSIFALLVLAILTIRFRKQFPLTTYGILWFLLNLSIESTVLPLELVFEHRLYLPSIGIVMSAVVVIHGLLRKALGNRLDGKELATTVWCMVAILVSASTLATFQRNEAWRDPLTLNRDNVSKAPLNPRAHANLAAAMLHRKMFLSALAEARLTIDSGRKHFEQYCVGANTIIMAYQGLGLPEKAIEEGEKLLSELPPDRDVGALPLFYLNLSSIYLAKKEYIKAFQTCKRGMEHNLYLTSGVINPDLGRAGAKVLRQILMETNYADIDLDGDGVPDPGNLSAEAWTSRFLIDLGDRAIGEALLASHTATHPDDIEAALILDAAKKWDEAGLAQSEKWGFHRKYLAHPFSLYNLNMAVALLICEYHLPAPLSTLGEACLDRAMRLKPDSSDAHLLKGWYHRARGEFQEALAEGTRAIELDPESAKAWVGVAFFQDSLNRREEAISSFRKSIELFPGCPERRTIQGIVATIERQSAGTASPLGS